MSPRRVRGSSERSASFGPRTPGTPGHWPRRPYGTAWTPWSRSAATAPSAKWRVASWRPGRTRRPWRPGRVSSARPCSAFRPAPATPSTKRSGTTDRGARRSPPPSRGAAAASTAGPRARGADAGHRAAGRLLRSRRRGVGDGGRAHQDQRSGPLSASGGRDPARLRAAPGQGRGGRRGGPRRQRDPRGRRWRPLPGRRIPPAAPLRSGRRSARRLCGDRRSRSSGASRSHPGGTASRTARGAVPARSPRRDRTHRRRPLTFEWDGEVKCGRTRYTLDILPAVLPVLAPAAESV